MTTPETRGLLHRLRERGVIRVALSYAVIAWLLLQIADVTFEPLGVPRWVMVSLIVTAVLGFPVAVALAWFYEVGDRGLERDTTDEGTTRPAVHGLRRYADVAIIGVLLVAVAVLLVRQSELGQTGTGHSTIAVLPFQNLSTSPDGEVLALGIAESVLHQLANLAELDVISRTSSFAFRDRREDAREIGRQLGARYLLEGSVQSDRSRMRVTTQLIDTETGADVWSMRFDRSPGDIFAVQDEIALQVTQALELSLDASATDRMTGQGTRNLDAYLAFLQGRSLLANNRVVDTKKAIGHFERSVQIDPDFAAAYVSLAQAEVFVAEYDVTDDRQDRFERALLRGQGLVEKALSLDPQSGDAYLQRAHLVAFEDLSDSEKDYRRGLALSPNSAKGYAGLATVLYETPSRRDEALEMLDRARKLDPLEPGYDVTKAVFLFYERSDVKGANALLVDVLERYPNYLPALVRLCELRAVGMGQSASAVAYCEQALALDPLSVEVRQHLVRLYLDLDDVSAAEQIAGGAARDLAVPQVLIAMHKRQWERAGEIAYGSLEGRTASPSTMGMVLMAIRMHARATGDFGRATIAAEDVADIKRDAAGRPLLTGGSPIRDAPIALADLLIASGEQQRGQQLLAAILGQMNREINETGRSEFWYYGWHPIALALNGDREAAITMLERAFAANATSAYRDTEPVFEGIRKEPRFQALVRKVRHYWEDQRRELDRMRAEGQVPDRTAGKP